MSYRSHVLDGLYTIRWGKQLELADVSRYAAEVAAARSSQQAPLAGLFMMPSDSPMPDEGFRKAQASMLTQIMSNLEFAVCVFEGSSFVVSLKRCALGTILLLAPKRTSIHVRSSVEEALITKPPGKLRFEPIPAIRELKKLRLI